MICLSSAGVPTSFQMLIKFECLSTSSFRYAAFTINEFTLENVTSALSVAVSSHCKGRVLSCLAIEGYLSHYDWVRREIHTERSIPRGEPLGASCVQKSDDSRFCNSHCLSHFAAFFIVVGT